jgi:hypothetical protein
MTIISSPNIISLFAVILLIITSISICHLSTTIMESGDTE